MNPWGLTDSQQQLLSLLVQHGNDKRVAVGMGLETQTIKTKLWHIRKKMGVHNRVLAAIAWDRFTREQASNDTSREAA